MFYEKLMSDKKLPVKSRKSEEWMLLLKHEKLYQCIWDFPVR